MARICRSPHVWVFLSASGVPALDGRCKAFDAAGDGSAGGAADVVLRRLSDALSAAPHPSPDRSSAVNHDGTSSGLTAPIQWLSKNCLRALDRAHVAPGRFATSKHMGPGRCSEIRSRWKLAKLWPELLGITRSGSARSPNIGHLEAAAGLLTDQGRLSFEHGPFRPSRTLRPTPDSWDQFPIAVPVAALPWKRGDARRFAGVSSFGMSGTNAHVLLEEASRALPAPPNPRRPVQWIPLSADSPEAMAQLAGRYERHLAENPSIDLGDVAYTAGAGRTHFGVRTSVVAESPDDAREVLAQIASRQVSPSRSGTDGSPLRLAFLYTGQGSQHANMGRSLYENQPSFRRELERCDALLHPVLGRSVVDVIFPTNANPDLIHETAYTQPALFAWEYALARLLQSWGIQPAAACHSIGNAAAVLAGASA